MASGILAQVDTACGAARQAVLCCLRCCLFMAAGVSSEVTWPPPPPQWLPRSPRPPGPKPSAVIQAPGDARGPLCEGLTGEECQPHACRWGGVAAVWQELLPL